MGRAISLGLAALQWLFSGLGILIIFILVLFVLSRMETFLPHMLRVETQVIAALRRCSGREASRNWVPMQSTGTNVYRIRHPNTSPGFAQRNMSASGASCDVRAR